MKRLITTLLPCMVLCCSVACEQTNSKNTDGEVVVVTMANGVECEKLGRDEYNNFLKSVPELCFSGSDIASPETLYNLNIERGDCMDFNSEAGQDNYYIWYAWFLQDVNGGEKYQTQREALYQIYSTINNTYNITSMGGTGFAHEQARIPARVEYDLYCAINSGALNAKSSETVDASETVNAIWNKIKMDFEIDVNDDMFPLQYRAKQLHDIYENMATLQNFITNKFYQDMTNKDI